MSNLITRRNFLAAGAAATAVLPATASALELPDAWRPQVVPMPARYRPGVILVYPDRFSLFWTLPDGNALRFAVRVGRGELYEPGVFYVGAKKVWPSWKPTPGMVEREPHRWARYAEKGMPGGPNNPLGARALYLFQPGRGDTFLRIHGTNDPGSIARAVSNGCVGLLNEHIVQLYELVPMKTEVYLYPKANEPVSG